MIHPKSKAAETKCGRWNFCKGIRALCVGALAFAAACASASPDSAHSPSKSHAKSAAASASAKSSAQASVSSASSLSKAPASPPPPRPGRIPLGEAAIEYLETSIESIPGGQSLLFVSQHADWPVAYARRYGAAEKQFGPLLRFDDEYLWGAFDLKTKDKPSFAILSSTGSEVCISQFEIDGDQPKSRACHRAAPSFIVQIDDQLAFIESEIERPPEPAGAKAKAEPPKSASNAKAGAKKSAPKSQKPAPKSKKAPAKGKKPASKSKKPSKNAKKSKESSTPAPKKRKEFVNIRLRFIAPSGEAQGESLLTGLRFQKPMDGMALIDAQGREKGADLIWYEPAQRPISNPKSPMGRVKIAGGSLRADGHFDPNTIVPVLEGDLEYGGMVGHHSGRLYATPVGTFFIGLTGRPGGCESLRIAPSLSLIQPNAAACSVAPERMAELLGALPQAELLVYQKLLGQEPRRRFAQPRFDPGLVAWAGDRGFFVSSVNSANPSAASSSKEINSKELVQAISRQDGVFISIDQPFEARRSRMAWAALALDGQGEALAMLSGKPVLIDARGNRNTIEWTAPVSSKTPGLIPPPPLQTPEDAAIDRRHAAKIGNAWFYARGDVQKIYPAQLELSELKGHAHPDTSVLVGGKEAGLWLELWGKQLKRYSINSEGIVKFLNAGSAFQSPVRAGFDAAQRAEGGAIVAGVSAANADEVLAFRIDAEGKPGKIFKTTLKLEPGEILVRLSAFPRGGALLSDMGRTHAIWLDEEGREEASMPWPPNAPQDDKKFHCLDGVPGRKYWPSPVAGVMAELPELGVPGTCIVGDPVWSANEGDDKNKHKDTLKWLGSFEQGMHSQAELGSISIHSIEMPAESKEIPKQKQPQGMAPLFSRPEDPPCPPEMVSIAGKYCVDRFESMLVDKESGDIFSPDYPATPKTLDYILSEWSMGRSRIGDVHARAMPLPFLARWQRGKTAQVVAVSRMGARPNGYVTGILAESACAAAGKRLCTLDEFVMACRGENDTLFPYGDSYEDGTCNVFRENHPAAILHGNASVGHLDPRLNRVKSSKGPLFRDAGATPACRSVWGSDAVYDMVGNLDEWVNEEGGAFAGGFYGRSTRSGCEALITAHPKAYLDYSTGVRCCRDAGPPLGHLVGGN